MIFNKIQFYWILALNCLHLLIFFRAGHSTVEQLHRVVDQILTAYDNREAFDRVWHARMVLKIKQTLPAPYFGLLRSYLEGRRFVVRFHTALSTEDDVAAEVPQGSVLGPLLYCLYSLDMPHGSWMLHGTRLTCGFEEALLALLLV